MGPASLRGYRQHNLRGLIKLVFQLWFLSLMSKVTLYTELKGERERENPLIYYFITFLIGKQSRAVAFRVKLSIFNFWRFLIWSCWVIYPNVVRLCSCRYRALKGRWDAIAKGSILSGCNQGLFPNLLTVFQQWRKERRNKEKWRQREREGGRKEARRATASPEQLVWPKHVLDASWYMMCMYLYTPLIVDVVPES